MRTFKIMLPSWHLSVLALIVGFGLALLNEELHGHSAQALMWSLIHAAGWWWWSIYIVLAFVGLFYMARLAPPETKWGHASRVMLYAGFDCYACCWGNTALGPLAAFLILAGCVMIIRQQAMKCADVRQKDRARDDWQGVPLGLRALITLTDKGHAQ